MSPRRFNSGRVMVSLAVMEYAVRRNLAPVDYLVRHTSGDWGEADAQLVKANELAEGVKGRAVSRYVLKRPDRKHGGVLVVVTDFATGVTELMFESEYLGGQGDE